MHQHAPADYHCPFCDLTPDREPDVVYRNERVFAMICPRWWPRNAGHLLIIPVDHHENLYSLPAEDGHAIFDATQLLARAMRTAYDCAGVSTHQHNEPAGDQGVWHFHQHLFPRYPGDDLYGTPPHPEWLPADHRRACAERLRAALPSQSAGVRTAVAGVDREARPHASQEHAIPASSVSTWI